MSLVTEDKISKLVAFRSISMNKPRTNATAENPDTKY